jgi:hypothetical protein
MNPVLDYQVQSTSNQRRGFRADQTRPRDAARLDVFWFRWSAGGGGVGAAVPTQERRPHARRVASERFGCRPAIFMDITAIIYELSSNLLKSGIFDGPQTSQWLQSLVDVDHHDGSRRQQIVGIAWPTSVLPFRSRWLGWLIVWECRVPPTMTKEKVDSQRAAELLWRLVSHLLSSVNWHYLRSNLSGLNRLNSLGLRLRQMANPAHHR